MPVNDVAMPYPLQVAEIAIPRRVFEESEITSLNDGDLAFCTARMLHRHFQIATLHHTADLKPALLEVAFDDATLAGVGTRVGLVPGTQKWDPIANESQFAFAMSADQRLPLDPPGSGCAPEVWRRTLLQRLVQMWVTANFGDGRTTIKVPRLRM